MKRYLVDFYNDEEEKEIIEVSSWKEGVKLAKKIAKELDTSVEVGEYGEDGTDIRTELFR
ncbi:MAG TPA: hypothetical protein VFD17_01920 [Clostridia bacterium]|nr:hypothetical protein [Clostridia bacterium]